MTRNDLTTLFNEHHNNLIGYANAHKRHHIQHPEDIVAELWYTLMEGDKYYEIDYNRALSWCRSYIHYAYRRELEINRGKKWSSPPFDTHLVLVDNYGDASRCPKDADDADHEKPDLREAIKHLGPQQQKVVELYLVGLTWKEIAQKSGLTSLTAQRYLQYAIRRLRKLMGASSAHAHIPALSADGNRSHGSNQAGL